MKRFGMCALVLGVASLNAACGSDEANQTGAAGATGGSGAASSGTTGSGTTGSGTTGSGTTGSGTTGSGTTGSGTTGSSTASTGSGGQSGGALPEGDTGIASMHPGDVGIETDPDVIFADNFETYSQASELNQRWDAVYQNQDLRIATEPANVYAGSKALEMKVPQMNGELSNATDKVLTQERDVLFLRYYSKFQPPYDVVGSSHNGSMISAHYFINGMATPGVPADGMNKFLANLENWRGDAATASPGDLNIYIYHPEQRDVWGDHFFPTGVVLPNTSLPFDFGPGFVSRPDIIPDLDRWYCYEYMVKANTPGQRDGRIAFWLDGKLSADFQNLRLRDIDSLKIDRFGLSFHIHDNPNGETKKWYDNVVAATSYIGPLVP